MSEKTSSRQPTCFENTHLLLILLWLVFLVRGLFYISVTPLWEGFDEHVHFAYVQTIAEGLGLPLVGRDAVTQEIYLSLKSAPLPREPNGFHLGYTHDEYWKLPADERKRLQQSLQHIPPAWRRVPNSSQEGTHLDLYEAHHPPLYYFLSALPYWLTKSQNIVTRVFAVRIFSLLISSLVVFLSFYAANLVFKSRELSFAISGIVVFMPQLMIDVCRVGNDAAAIVLFSALVLLSTWPRAINYRVSFLIGCVLGLGLLTKAYFVTAVPALGMVFLLPVLKRSESLKERAVCLAITLFVAAAISGWWYVRNYILLGSVTGLHENIVLQNVTVQHMIAQIPNVDWLNAIRTIGLSHVWFGNWSFLQLRSWMYHVFEYLFLLSMLGILIYMIRRWLGLKVETSSERNVINLSFFYLWFWVGLLYYVLLLYLWQGVSSANGWYLYTVIIPEVILLVFGWFCLVPIRWRQKVLATVTSLFCLLDLYGILFNLIPYYTGFIWHRPGRGLMSFKPFDLSGADYGELLSRLTINKPPFMSTAYYVTIGAVFILISLSALILCLRTVFLGKRLQTDEPLRADQFEPGALHGRGRSLNPGVHNSGS